MKSKKIMALMLILLIALQCVIYTGVAKDKQYLHMDEAHSLGQAQYHGPVFEKNHDIFGNWQHGDYFRDYLIVDADELSYTEAVFKNQAEDNHPPMYFFFLRFYMEFTSGTFSMMSALTLNIMIYALITLMMYFITKRLFKADKYQGIKAFTLTAISSLLLSTLSNVIFIRMYAMLTLQIMFILFIHIKQYESGHTNIWYAILSIFVIAGGVLTHYYFLLFLLPMYLLFMARYIREKQFKDAIAYTLYTAVGIGAAFYTFKSCSEHIFKSYTSEKFFEKLFDFGGYKHALEQFAKHINTYVFHASFLFIAVAMAVCVVVLIVKKAKASNMAGEGAEENIADGENEDKKEKGMAGGIITILFPTLVYFLVAAVASPYTELRYMYPICALIFALVGALVYHLAKKAFGAKISLGVMCLILALMAVMPVYKNIEPQTLYSEKASIVEYAKEHKEIPVLYAYTTQTERILDDIYLLTFFEHVYITRDWDINSGNMTDVFINTGKDISNGVIVIINVPQNDTEILECIRDTLGLSSIQHIEGLNMANVYYIAN